jgi:hypothetical protein
MRVRPIAFGIITIALFAGTVGVTMATGAWQTTGRQGAGSGGGSGSVSGGGSGTEGSAAVGDVKGWMAIGDVAKAAGIDLPEVLAAFALPADTPPTTALKDLESDAFSVPALRAWLGSRSAVAPPAPAPTRGGTAAP